MSNIKKGLLALSTATLLCLPAIGQEKRVEHNFYIGLGGAHSFEGVDDPYAFHIGYGLDYYLTRHWSIMPGIGYRAKFEVGDYEEGIGSYDCSYFDVPVLIQYHLSNPRKSRTGGGMRPCVLLYRFQQPVLHRCRSQRSFGRQVHLPVVRHWTPARHLLSDGQALEAGAARSRRTD